MIGPALIVIGSCLIFGVSLFNWGRNNGYFGYSDSDLKMDISRGEDFSKADLPSVGSSNEKEDLVVRLAYLVGFLCQLTGSIIYLGGIYGLF